jgi:hypothetical protein
VGVDLGRLARNECHIWDIITLMHHIVWCRQLEIEMTTNLGEMLRAKLEASYVKPEIAYHMVDPDDVAKLRKLSAQLHGGTDRERDYGHRLWLIVNKIEALGVPKRTTDEA